MTNETKEKLEELTAEELEELLEKKRKKEAMKAEADRKKYEAERDELVVNMANVALDLNRQMREFKQAAFDQLLQFKERLDEYGEIRKNSKGGFSLVNDAGDARVKYTYRSLSFWDERSAKAEDLLKDFLADTIKKKDQTLHDIILELLEKNKKGQLEFARISKLYKYEDRYNDPRWKEALKLFKESFNSSESKYDLYFQVKDERGEWQTLNLTFNSI